MMCIYSSLTKFFQVHGPQRIQKVCQSARRKVIDKNILSINTALLLQNANPHELDNTVTDAFLLDRS